MDFTKDIKFNINPTVNQTLAITYNGFLAGSESVSIVYGFGENWEHTTETVMSKNENGFVANIKMLNFDTFNFCFKNNYNEWDNNSCCNYITHIEPAIVQTIDIDALIEEILQPVILFENQEVLPVQVFSTPIDLGEEISKVLSHLDDIIPCEDMSDIKEFSTLDEILTCEVISSHLIEEENAITDFSPIDLANDLQACINECIVELEEQLKKEENLDLIEEINLETENQTVASIETTETSTETSLIPMEDNFMVSPRKLSKFYTFRKRLKLAFYKAFVKIPKLIFGLEED